MVNTKYVATKNAKRDYLNIFKNYVPQDYEMYFEETFHWPTTATDSDIEEEAGDQQLKMCVQEF